MASRHALALEPAGAHLAVRAVAGFPVQSNGWTLYRKGKQLLPVDAAVLQRLEHAGASG